MLEVLPLPRDPSRRTTFSPAVWSLAISIVRVTIAFVGRVPRRRGWQRLFMTFIHAATFQEWQKTWIRQLGCSS